MKRSKIDRLFRLWDCLCLLRNLGLIEVGQNHTHNMEARKKLRKLISEEYDVPKPMLANNNLTINGCIYLIRERR